MKSRVAAFVIFSLPAQDLPREAGRILQENCQTCHGAQLRMSDLDMRTREAMLAGGKRGAAIVPGAPEKSNIYLFAAHKAKPEMPPAAKLKEAEIEILRRWIAAGATMAAGVTIGRTHWAFVAPVRPVVPAAENAIDYFLKPGPPAPPRTLVRRAYLDLLGLPPSPEEVQAFLDDKSPDAWEKLVERLLASPHYGERWARHWLDVVRYADSGGFERDYDRPDAWRYRDYVIRAFNDDKPYDQFASEQIAGDEIAPDSSDARIATGFLRLGVENNIRDERTRLDELDDVVSTTSLAFLGMTVGCARCHDHKFDPIPQQDYYRIQAVFFPAKPVEHPLVPRAAVDAHNAEVKRIRAIEAPQRKQVEALEKPYRDLLFDRKLRSLPEYMQLAWNTPPERRTEGQKLNAQQIERTARFSDEEVLAEMSAEDKAHRARLGDELKAIAAGMPKPYPRAMAVGEDSRTAPVSHLLVRGDPSSKGLAMSPGVLSAAAHGEVIFPDPPPEAKSSHRRRGFAQWLTAPANPLTARVMVNRIWQHHFGRGIVATSSNFGKTGQRPSHPDLLDWLSVEFMDRRWSVKAMHRLMVNSRAYRAAAMTPRRLEAEALRDSMLAVAGTLDRTMGGPAVFPHIDPSLFQSSTMRTWPGRPDEDRSTWRRSVYVFSKRSIRYPLFEAFDQPDMIVSCGARNRSTTAPQALMLMNNAAVQLQVKAFAARLRAEAGAGRAAQVDRAFLLALARPPSAEERAGALAFLDGSPEKLEDFCQTIFNLNEFAYMP